MSSLKYAIRITEIIVHKFGTPPPAIPDNKTSINIFPQVAEIALYESIFTPVMKCELAVIDFVGLIWNFPLAGEEFVTIRYENVGDEFEGVGVQREYTFAIESITSISTAENNRAMSYMINCVSLEGLVNSLGTIQVGYRDTTVRIAEAIYNDHIKARITNILPNYKHPNIFVEDNSSPQIVRVIPNMYPLAAIDMVNELADTESASRYSYLFYQNPNGFHFRTIQGLIDNEGSRRYAWNNRYKYMSEEIPDSGNMENETRIVKNLIFNRRLTSTQKLVTGYHSNNIMEINIAQKAIHSTRRHVDDEEVVKIYPNQLSTKKYTEWAKSYDTGEEASNRTKYWVTTRPEHDNDYPVIRNGRTIWGKNLITKIGLSQIDVHVAIAGTSRFVAGDLFYLEIPEFHGFNNIEEDSFSSGYYLITEVKHIINTDGYHSTVLRLNKDSYKESIDRESRYGDLNE